MFNFNKGDIVKIIEGSEFSNKTYRVIEHFEHLGFYHVKEIVLHESVFVHSSIMVHIDEVWFDENNEEHTIEKLKIERFVKQEEGKKERSKLDNQNIDRLLDAYNWCNYLGNTFNDKRYKEMAEEIMNALKKGEYDTDFVITVEFEEE